MALNNPNPLTTEVIEAKTFLELWLSSILIRTAIIDGIEAGLIRIETLPYNSELKEIGSGKDMIEISTDELFLAVSQVPEVAVAMGAIFQCIDPLRDWIAAREAEKLAAESAG